MELDEAGRAMAEWIVLFSVWGLWDPERVKSMISALRICGRTLLPTL